MKIAILSDTHDHVENILKAVEKLKYYKPERWIHLGDFISPGGVKQLTGTTGIGVLGNNDGDIFELQEAFVKINWKLAGYFYEEEIDGLKIACYHGTVQPITDALIKCGTYDVVLTGHTHQPVIETIGKTLHINPGTVHGIGNKPTAAVLDTKTKEAEIVEF